ncbi:malto-oligosyltrehalose synthase [Brachybacterium huguangmaarense]
MTTSTDSTATASTSSISTRSNTTRARGEQIVPLSTYRLQLHAGFTFNQAAAQVPYLAALGVSHLFCSPVLQAAPGSTHGYDVVDHTRISDECGGEDGLRRLAAAAHEHGMGLVVDVVPNHMAIPTPIWHNRALWDVLESGPASPYAHWFDLDATTERGILVPVLGRPIGEVLAAGDIALDEIDVPQADGSSRRQRVVRYFDHVLPVAAGTESLGIADLLERQWYRLAYWKVADDELNYRRFFDVDTLAAVRVEDPTVFEATHRLLLDLHAEGVIDGFRIDHPDGLADPRGYLADLAEASDGAWTVVEKILEGDEQLPGDFACAGTTGYDALWRVGGQFQDGRGVLELTGIWQRYTGDLRGFEEVASEATALVVSTSLWAEIERLTALVHRICSQDIRLRDTTRRNIQRAIVALLESMDRYRAYIVPGERAPKAQRDVIAEAADRARPGLGEDPDVLATLDLVVALACGDEVGSAGRTDAADRAEFIVRFAQTCGPVHAKGLEDTAFYRYNRFIAVNEVGANPDVIGVEPDDLHDHCQRMLRTFPDAMTTLSTHDTKRSEDVRARLAVLTEQADEWARTVAELREATLEGRSERVDGATALLLWQTLAGTWDMPGAPNERITMERLGGYLTKAMREAKTHTTWTAPDEEYEQGVQSLAETALASEEVARILDEWTRRTHASQRAAILGQKIVQLMMPGVPDVYQGNETTDFSLVDPDNRRSVDLALRAERLDRMSAGARPDGVADEKLWVTCQALGLRAERPAAFRGREATYVPIATTSGHALAFGRGTEGGPVEVVTVATRLPVSLAQRGGWGENTLVLPKGRWTDRLTGRGIDGGMVRLADLLGDLPVALLVRDADTDTDTATGTEIATETETAEEAR